MKSKKKPPEKRSPAFASEPKRKSNPSCISEPSQPSNPVFGSEPEKTSNPLEKSVGFEIDKVRQLLEIYYDVPPQTPLFLLPIGMRDVN